MAEKYWAIEQAVAAAEKSFAFLDEGKEVMSKTPRTDDILEFVREQVASSEVSPDLIEYVIYVLGGHLFQFEKEIQEKNNEKSI
jgi:hypothetical protein